MLQIEKYPHLEWFFKETGIAPADLVKGFELEKQFHEKILGESNTAVRKELYLDLYRALVPLYEKSHNPESGPNSKLFIVDMFKKELEGRSILDVGCGAGNFLICVSDRFNNKTLFGIDVVLPQNFQKEKYKYIRLKEADVIDFILDEKFDVVFSDNVIEHLAPADLSMHLKSINRALTVGGTLIAILPNRLFGPSDATRIIDNTHTNRVPALGSHLNESTYGEFIPLLRESGFGKFKTTLQFPVLHRTVSRLLKLIRITPIRITPSIYVWIEKSPKLLNGLYKLRRRHSYLFMLPLIIICKKVESPRA